MVQDKNKFVVFLIYDIGCQQECQVAHYVIFLYMRRRNYVSMMSDLKFKIKKTTNLFVSSLTVLC